MSSSARRDPSKQQTVTISFTHPGTRPPVFVAGNFTNPPWQPQELECAPISLQQVCRDLRFNGADFLFSKQFEIFEGEWQYKLRQGLDDWWFCDNNTETVLDEDGNAHNLLRVLPTRKVYPHEDKHAYCRPFHDVGSNSHDSVWDVSQLDSPVLQKSETISTDNGSADTHLFYNCQNQAEPACNERNSNVGTGSIGESNSGTGVMTGPSAEVKKPEQSDPIFDNVTASDRESVARAPSCLPESQTSRIQVTEEPVQDICPMKTSKTPKRAKTIEKESRVTQISPTRFTKTFPIESLLTPTKGGRAHSAEAADGYLDKAPITKSVESLFQDSPSKSPDSLASCEVSSDGASVDVHSERRRLTRTAVASSKEEGGARDEPDDHEGSFFVMVIRRY